MDWGPPYCTKLAGSRSAVIPILLAHPDIDVNVKNKYGFTPLWRAARYGHLDVIQWWIASGREMDFGKPGDGKTDAIGGAKQNDETEVATLLERFQSDATQTRHTVRVELGWYDEVAAEMFALVFYVSDGLLQVKGTTISTPAAKFFTIATQLPLELQMVLCYRLVESDKEIIQGKESEVAFKSLAETLLWSSIFTS